MKTTSQFRSTPSRAALALAAALICSTSAFVQAQPNPDRPDRPGQPAGEGRHHQQPPGGPGGFRTGPGGPMLEQLLTEDQRDSLRQTMEAQRDKMRGLQEKIRDARKALMTAAFAEDYQEATVRAKALEVAKLEADVTVLRLKAIAEVQPALSQAQLEKILNPPAPPSLEPGGDEPRPPQRRGNRPPGGPRAGDDLPPPPKRDPQ